MKNNKSLGQHWLKNRAILDKIADLALTDDSDATLCVEIGPGLGTLTSSLLKRFTKVVAVEYDQRLAHNLPQSFPGKQLEVICDDILAVDLAQITDNQSYVVVGNIPYYITSPIVRKLITVNPKPRKIVLLMQKEVAERIAAEPGKQSMLSLTTQNLAAVELGPVVSAAEFTPPPKVDSQVIILEPLEQPQINPAILELAQRGFASPRKKLAHNLANSTYSKADWQEILKRLKINPDARAQDLSLWDWEELSNASHAK